MDISSFLDYAEHASDFVAAIGGLLLGVTFTRLQRRKHTWLKLLDGKQLFLFCVCVVSMGISFVAGAMKHYEAIEESKKISGQSHTEVPVSYLPGDARLNAAVSMAMSAEEMFSSKRYEEARERFRLADELTDIASIKARIADSSFHLKDYESAVAYSRAAMSLAPNWSGPPYLLAHSLSALGNTDAAIRSADLSCSLGFEESCRYSRLLQEKSN